jgi:hypothetical protein
VTPSTAELLDQAIRAGVAMLRTLRRVRDRLRADELQAGRRSRVVPAKRVLVATRSFYPPAEGALVTVEFDLFPEELARLGDRHGPLLVLLERSKRGGT